MARDMKFFSSDMKQQSREIARAIQKDLPRIVAVEGINFFQSSWRKQGFEDNGVQKWKARKSPPKVTPTGKVSGAYLRWKQKNNRPILYSHSTDRKGTHLKDSVRAIQGISRVTFATDKVYAQVHNEGGRAGRGKGFIMPKRQFMGHSRALDRRIISKANRLLTSKLQ